MKEPKWNMGDPKTWIALIMVVGVIALCLLKIPIPEWLTIQTAMVLAFYYRDRRSRTEAAPAPEEPRTNTRTDQWIAYLAAKIEELEAAK